MKTENRALLHARVAEAEEAVLVTRNSDDSIGVTYSDGAVKGFQLLDELTSEAHDMDEYFRVNAADEKDSLRAEET